MGTNFVQIGNEVVVDLTNDSVTPETLAEGETAHDNSGNLIRGTMTVYKNLTLGVHTDGLLYVFSNGQPIGTGIEMPDKIGDIYGTVDSGNTIMLKGYIPNGTYTFKYELDNGNVVNIGSAELDNNVYYAISKTLTYCTISNSATKVVEGSSYSATITANDGYELKSVTVTMGGANVSVTNGVINIAKVTGNIVINAVAEVAGHSYINQLPISTDINGNLYVGTNGEKGYKSGYRLSTSTGNESALAGSYVTGFMPATKSDTIRIKNITLNSTDGYNGFLLYDAEKVALQPDTLGGGNFNVSADGVYSVKMNIYNKCEECAYIRFSCKTISDDTIVTVNQEIV